MRDKKRKRKDNLIPGHYNDLELESQATSMAFILLLEFHGGLLETFTEKSLEQLPNTCGCWEDIYHLDITG